jgi:GNAT superfamily N-acetyltransferase
MIRLARGDDVPALAALRARWVEENAGRPIEDTSYLAAFEAWYAAEEHQRLTWLGLVEDEPVGMLNLLVFTRMPRPAVAVSRWGYLANFYVRPEHRSSGLGTELLGVCTSYADEHAFARIVLSPSERSVPLYARTGFAPATELMVRPGPG